MDEVKLGMKIKNETKPATAHNHEIFVTPSSNFHPHPQKNQRCLLPSLTANLCRNRLRISARSSCLLVDCVSA